MIVKELNQWLYLTAYGLYDKPKIVALAGAPPDQVQFAKEFGESWMASGVIIEDNLDISNKAR
jgi:hypothetical protein